MQIDFNAITAVIKKAGEIVLSAHNQEQTISEKTGKKNFVTKYDVAVQNFLFEELKKIMPEAEFIGEEEGAQSDYDGLRFIIDPIDGTTNFVQDYRCSTISVALCDKNEPIAGVVYNPYTGEVFHAEKGKGAFLNGKPIKVSERPLSDGIAIFGSSPYHPEYTDEVFDLLKKVFTLSRDIRRNGSAAYDICLVSCGRAEIFFEKDLNPWDYAAGMIILKEAGGIAMTYQGESPSMFHACDIAMANPKANAEFFELLK